jgi:hypothetical protein
VAMLLGSSLVQPCGSKIRHENEKDASAILVRILQTRRLTIRGRDGVATRSVSVRMVYEVPLLFVGGESAVQGCSNSGRPRVLMQEAVYGTG